MKRRLAAAALLAANAGCAWAQTPAASINVYGFIDASVRYQHGAEGAAVAVVDGSEYGWAGSRWGISGSEDLGGGLSAIMNLENGFAIDTGEARQGGRLFGRTAFVGLRGRYGELTLGRQYNALYYTGSWHSDPTYVSSWSPSVVHQLDYAWDNAIAYTGQLDDVIVRATYAPGEKAGMTRGARQAVSVLYNGQPFGLALAYGGADGHGLRTFNVGGYYTAGAWTVQATHYLTRNEPYSGARRVATHGLGAIYLATPALELTGAWWRTDSDGSRENKYLAVARYSLSKRSKLYVEGDTATRQGKRRISGVQAGMQFTF